MSFFLFKLGWFPGFTLSRLSCVCVCACNERACYGMIPQPRVGVTTGMALHCFRRAGDPIFHPSLSLSTYQNKGGESHPRCWFALHLVGKLSYVIDSSFSHQYSLSPPQFGLKTPSRPSRVDKGCFHWITWFLSVFFFIQFWTESEGSVVFEIGVEAKGIWGAKKRLYTN